MNSADSLGPGDAKTGKTVTLRPAAAADEPFLLEVYASTRAEEMAHVPWSAEQKEAFLGMQFTAQKQHYAAEYPCASHDIICVDDVPVGRLYLDRGQKAFHILDVTILPRFRGSGAGTSLLERILAEAAQSGKPVTIYVESFNPSLRLFGKLGFERIAENGLQCLLRRLPSP
jgi:ribosomal protein S18 acetylase RimI-like enzyme